MNYFFLILLSFIILSNQLVCSEIDSLTNALNKSKDKIEKVTILLHLSTLIREDNPEESIEFAKEALNLSSETKDKTLLLKSYAKLGITYKNLDSLDNSLEYFLKGLELSKETDDKKWQTNFLNYIGSLYLRFNQNQKALNYYQKSLKLADSISDTVGLCNVLNNIGIIYWRDNKLDSSVENIHKSLLLSIDLKDSSGLISSYNNLGMLHSELGNDKRALGYFNQALVIAKKLNDKWEIANIINNRANLRIKLKDFDSVDKDLNESIQISKKIDSKLLEADSYQILSYYYERIKDFGKALDAFKTYSNLNSEILNKETSDKLASIQKDYEINVKDRNLKTLSKANSIQYYLIILFGITLILLGTFIFVYLRKFLENKSMAVELKKKNDDLEKLSDNKNKFFTLISHDLKAPLYNISNLSNLLKMFYENMDETERTETLEQLNKSSKHLLTLVDNILIWSKTQVGTIENNPEELQIKDLIDESIDILKPLADEKDIILNTYIDDINVKADYNLLSTTIRNLISNAIKFSNSKSAVTIKTEVINNEFLIKVKDTGIGIEPERIVDIMNGTPNSTPGTHSEKGTGLGLRITKELIEIIGGNLTATSELGKGSTFTIKLPIEE